MASRTAKWMRLTAAAAVVGILVAGCGPAGQAGSQAADAAGKVYVSPGTYDEFYFFTSGGYSGNLGVYGLPSGRLLQQVPVFSQYPEKGYGYSEQTRALLNTSYGFMPWDDAHHPKLSQTDGIPDGRWLFINGNNTPRVARIDLSTFETVEIIEVPNTGGNHASPFLTQGTEYVVAATRFSVPTPQADVSIKEFATRFGAMLTFIRVDPATGRMAVAFQVKMPGYQYDIAHAGKGPSHGWAFFTTYNTEQAYSLLERGASQNDKDYIAAVNWQRAEQCVTEGRGQRTPARYAHNSINDQHIAETRWQTEVTVLDPATCADLVYFLPTPKSPHGVDVDPTGEYIVAGGKLATALPVHSFAKMQAAIQNQAFEKTVDGIPVIRYEEVMKCEVQNPGLGPLHTEFDATGHAYTSVFISSEIIKWNLERCEVVDRIPAYYSIGHLSVPGGDSRQPWGKYAIALNKITKDRYLPTGPELTHSAQLYDITGDKMKLLLDFPTVGEPHYAQALPASLIRDKQVQTFSLADNKDPYAVKSERETRVVRQGTKVHVYMSSIRSHFMPDNIEGIQVGDSVFFHVTNLEQDWDVPHGFAIMGMRNAEILVMPGQTRTVAWVPDRVGVYPFYCTDFCSALHQEMSGWARVSPRGSSVPLSWNKPGE